MMKLKGRNQRKELIGAIEHGRRLLVDREYEDARNFLEGALQRFPKDAEIRMLYATILLEFRPNDVASEAAKAVDLDQDNPAILVSGGQLLLKRGRIEDAQKCATRARERATANFALLPSLLNLEGNLAVFEKDYDLAEEKLRAAVECDPAGVPFATELAKFLRARGRRAEALAVIARTLELSPGKEEDLVRLQAQIASEIGS
jgi:Tfp pilus assembly protein PilF